MKKVIIFCFSIAMVFTAIIKIGEITNGNVGLGDLAIMSQAQAESGYPIGEYCGRDECEKACGIPPYVYTAHGHYWHCKWQEIPGVCVDEMCNRACDAMCIE